MIFYLGNQKAPSRSRHDSCRLKFTLHHCDDDDGDDCDDGGDDHNNDDDYNGDNCDAADDRVTVVVISLVTMIVLTATLIVAIPGLKLAKTTLYRHKQCCPSNIVIIII